jgi:hypothetical protein
MMPAARFKRAAGATNAAHGTRASHPNNPALEIGAAGGRRRLQQQQLGRGKASAEAAWTAAKPQMMPIVWRRLEATQRSGGGSDQVTALLGGAGAGAARARGRASAACAFLYHHTTIHIRRFLPHPP